MEIPISNPSGPSTATIKRLFALSGNRCAFPKCDVPLVTDSAVTGEICHIKAQNQGGPRYDPHQTVQQRHSYDNLILMCSTHHKVIDDDEATYTAEYLHRLKKGQEQVASTISDADAENGASLLLKQSVSSTNQSGGITAHTVHVHNYASPAVQSEAPSLVFVFGAPLGDNNSSSWIMLLKHYGSEPAYNCNIDFYDEDRKNIEHEWLVKHPHSPFLPPGMFDKSQHRIHIPEAAPEGSAGSFPWNPLDPDRQHYNVCISCRAGVFVEKLEITRVEGCLRARITIERGPQWAQKNPESERTVFGCEDPEFISAPLLSEIPKVAAQRVHPGWKPNHRFDLPAAIIDPNGNLQVANVKFPDGVIRPGTGCWEILTKRLGDDAD